MATVVATELGVDISCDEAGTFSAIINGKFERDKSITKVRKAIKAAAPTVALIKNEDRRYRAFPYLSVVHISHVRTEGGQVVGVEGKNDRYNSTYYDLCEFDQATLDAADLLEEEYAKRSRELTAWREERFKQLSFSLTPITEERFAVLLAEKAKR